MPGASPRWPFGQSASSRESPCSRFHGCGRPVLPLIGTSLYDPATPAYNDALESLRTLHFTIFADRWLSKAIGRNTGPCVLARPRTSHIDIFRAPGIKELRRMDLTRATVFLRGLKRLYFRGLYMTAPLPCVSQRSYSRFVISHASVELTRFHLHPTSFPISFARVNDFNGWEFASHDRILSAPCLPALNIIRLIYGSNLPEAKYAHKSKQMFPKTCRRGRLFIEKGPLPNEIWRTGREPSEVVSSSGRLQTLSLAAQAERDNVVAMLSSLLSRRPSVYSTPNRTETFKRHMGSDTDSEVETLSISNDAEYDADESEGDSEDDDAEFDYSEYQRERLSLYRVALLLRAFIKDTATVKACTLTCHSWHQALRAYIFRSLAIRNEDDIDKFQLLLMKEPNIKYLVYSIRFFDDQDCDDYFKAMVRIFDATPMSLPYLVSICFSITYGECRRPSLVALLLQMSRWTQIRALSFLDCSLPYAVTRAIICSPPSLDSVQIFGMDYTPQKVTVPKFLLSSAPRSLTALDLVHDLFKYEDMPHSLENIRIPEFSRTLRSLTTLRIQFAEPISFMWQADLESVIRAQTFSPLQILELSFQEGAPFAAILQTFNLRKFTQLRDLRIAGLPISTLTKFVAHNLNSRHLLRLGLIIPVEPEMAIFTKSCRELDQALASDEILYQLEDVHVQVSCAVSTMKALDQLAELVQFIMQGLALKDILRVSVVTHCVSHHRNPEPTFADGSACRMIQVGLVVSCIAQNEVLFPS
ncbi:hypothetical protein EIP91_000484 [Steccherinum ochraceum]|uniref:Uncharacterized protein n=1 Tax=Steccherinum ochraceum TaxID=92696 RepID=A0A4R0RSW9_9APHY|nr:hypothetical protein EIP91_000484 [Steccherinum ochraceum]